MTIIQIALGYANILQYKKKPIYCFVGGWPQYAYSLVNSLLTIKCVLKHVTSSLGIGKIGFSNAQLQNAMEPQLNWSVRFNESPKCLERTAHANFNFNLKNVNDEVFTCKTRRRSLHN